MILRLALFTLAGVVAVAGGAGFIAMHPWSDNRDRMRGGDSRSGGGGTFFREGGINGAVETAERRRRTGALCPLPAQMVSAADADWCVCGKGSVCEGSGCNADKWNPQEVKWFYSFFLLLSFTTFYFYFFPFLSLYMLMVQCRIPLADTIVLHCAPGRQQHCSFLLHAPGCKSAINNVTN